MQKRPLGSTGFEIAPLVFGGNVFNWTADEKTSFAMLDRFEEAGFNAIDSADVYSNWAPGNKGGESEIVLGKWLKASPGRRERTVVITKVGYDKGLSAKWITQAVENSLRRLQCEAVDLYLSHKADPNVPIEETLAAYDTLISQGKVKCIGSSNYTAVQLREALHASDEQGLPRYQVHQPEYSLYSRHTFEGPVRDLCMNEGLGVVTYYSLASGFLTGKYRSKADLTNRARGARVEKYLNDRGFKILEGLDEVAARTGATQAEVAIAWLINSKGVTAPIVSATTVEQVDALIRAANLKLSNDDMELLNSASAGSGASQT